MVGTSLTLLLIISAMGGLSAGSQELLDGSRTKKKIQSSVKKHQKSFINATNYVLYHQKNSKRFPNLFASETSDFLEGSKILKKIGNSIRFHKRNKEITDANSFLGTNIFLEDPRQTNHKITLSNMPIYNNNTFLAGHKMERFKRLIKYDSGMIYLTEDGQKVLRKLKSELAESTDYKVVPEYRRIKLGRDIDYNLGLSKKAPISYYIESHTIDPEEITRLNREAFCNIAAHWNHKKYSNDIIDEHYRTINESSLIMLETNTVSSENPFILKRPRRRLMGRDVLSEGMLRALKRKLLNIKLGNLRKSLLNHYQNMNYQIPYDPIYMKRNEEDEKKTMEDEDLLIRKLAKALITELGENEDANTKEPISMAQGSELQRGDAQPPAPAKEEEPKTPVQALQNNNNAAQNYTKPVSTGQMFVEPGLPCDYFDDETQSCWYDRQVGETLTITLRIKNDLGVYQNMEEHDYDIRWQRRFKIHNEKRVIVVNLASDQTPWNIVLGSGGAELRFSPLTDSDMDYNSFRVEVFDPHHKPSKCKTHNKEKRESDTCLAEITFRINIIPIDMGPMFSGEETLINIENYISLPFDAIVFDWQFERVDSTALALPSNMKVSPSGRSLAIKELRESQHGILECAMYSSKGMFIAKRRFAVHLPKSNSEYYRGTHKKRIVSDSDIYKGASIKLNIDKPVRNKIGRSAECAATEPNHRMRRVYSRKDNTTEVTTDVPPVNASLFYANLQTEADDDSDDQADETVEGEDVDEVVNTDEEVHDIKDDQQLANDKQQFPELVEPDTSEEDFKEEYIMTKCGSKIQCSPHASCIECGRSKQGFCHCNQGFHGNGVFCWESQR